MAILTIDQGTTGTTILLVDAAGQIIDRSYREFPQIYPQPGWVEHDPEAIWQTVVEGSAEICSRHPNSVQAIGITNQRETTVIWDATTSKPIMNAIVWQCRRTAKICRDRHEYADLIRTKTGLPLDAYFSASKIRWMLDHHEGDPHRLRFGTIDTWLIWKLTGGARHLTDYSNAARTMLFNIHTRRWDDELCDILLLIPNCCRRSRIQLRILDGFPACLAWRGFRSWGWPVISRLPCSVSSASIPDR